MLPGASLLWLTIASAAATELHPTWTPTTSVQAPLVSNCVDWYQAARGDSCYSISKPLHLSILAFLSMNPQIHENCTLVLPHYWYCVRVDQMIDSQSIHRAPALLANAKQLPRRHQFRHGASSLLCADGAGARHSRRSGDRDFGFGDDGEGSYRGRARLGGKREPALPTRGPLVPRPGVMITEIEWVPLTKQVPFTSTVFVVSITTAGTKG
ncbi:hypothetical protein DL769_011094 [Monosporascus sp. CRB-8-3]|nr:hypothetical protein DL769_011094 [Monosporascus sp. CRB-8-3]